MFALSTVFYIRLNIVAIINVRNKIEKVFGMVTFFYKLACHGFFIIMD